LDALSQQVLPAGASAEICLVDNGSTPALTGGELGNHGWLRIVREERPGLLAARLCGLRHTTGPYLVFIDDDTVPAPDFLSQAITFMEAHPKMGTAGGKILPRYQTAPPPWLEAFAWLLALRDNGPDPLEWSVQSGAALPNWTPIGAGLLVRRTALVPGYLNHVAAHAAEIERISWRGQGAGGVEDKDLVLHCLRAGWSTGYAPQMMLTHIIPPQRMSLAYFEKLLPPLETMWAQTLHAHGFESHRPIHPATLPLRKIKAWLVFQAWRSPVHRLRWLESCGYLDGLAANHRRPVRYDKPDAT
jgi:cellulose synthase/poly-beta-1,6-N-acetylglucosamine synthase-like glycosyltransferase